MARRSPRPRPSFCRRRTTICGNSLDVRTELPLFKRRSASGDISALRPEPIDGVSMRPKESGKVRYAYGVAMALLLGGTAFSLATGQAGAQVAQNAPGMSALAPRPGAPMSFADLVARLQPAVVNISTKQRIPVRAQSDPFEEFFRRLDPNAPPDNQQGGGGGGSGGSGAQPRA